MRNVVKLVAVGVMSALLAAALAGCVTVNVTKSESASSESASAASSTATKTTTSTTSTTGKSDSSTTATSSTSASSSSDWGRGDAEPVDLTKSQRFGNAKVGYVSVPSDWKDYTSKLDSRMVDDYATTYVVDPTTEFTSSVEAHFAFSSSIKLETYPCKYTEKADELLYKYRGETDNYTTPTIEKTTFNGKNASILGCSSADNVDITNIVIEKSSNSCILITAWATRSNDEAVLSYVSTWSMSK